MRTYPLPTPTRIGVPRRRCLESPQQRPTSLSNDSLDSALIPICSGDPPRLSTFSNTSETESLMLPGEHVVDVSVTGVVMPDNELRCRIADLFQGSQFGVESDPELLAQPVRVE